MSEAAGSPTEAIGLDVGGTKIAAVRIDERGRVLDRSLDSTPAESAEATVAATVACAERLATPRVGAVGIGAAGMIDAETGTLRFAPNLAWRDVRLAGEVSGKLGLPCIVDNDANTAAWGEFRFGAGRDAHDMLLVTVGTGIGGGVVSGGRLFRGAHGFAAEIGHIIVEPGGPLCGCGNHGCWEQVASGRAIDRLAGAAVKGDPSTPFANRFGGDPARARGEAITEAARDGDATALEIFRRVGSRLGEGIAGLVNVLDSEIVVAGGGAMDAGDFLLEPARLRFAETVEAADARADVPIVAAELGKEAGAIGAAKLALEELGG
ncbi:MAG: ROK family protein [Actinomycetota bacterium]